jgi:hypothetical protein
MKLATSHPALIGSIKAKSCVVGEVGESPRGIPSNLEVSAAAGGRELRLFKERLITSRLELDPGN